MSTQREELARRLLADALAQLTGEGAMEEHFREVFRHSFQCMWVLARDGTILDANQTALSVMALPRADVLGTKIWETQSWTESAQLPTDIRAAVAAVTAGAFVRFEVDALTRDPPLTLDLSFKSVTDRGGRVALIIAEGRDVGARARAERALRDSEERFNRIVSIAADAIISLDEAQRITLFNHGAEQIFGFSARDVIGQPLDILLPTGLDVVHGHAVRQFAAGAVEARRMGERGDIFGRRKSGEVFRAEASISKVTIGGRIVFTAVVRDVTERWTREQERAQLLEVATLAHEEAERERERVSFLADASEALSESLEYEQSLHVLARLLVPRLGTLCLVDVVDDVGRIRRVEAVHADATRQDVADRLRATPLREDRPHLAKRALETGEPQLIAALTPDHLRSLAPDDAHLDDLRSLGLASFLCLPLAARGSTLGVVALGRDESAPPYTEADRQLGQEIVRRAALAIDHATLYRRAQAASQQRDEVLGVVSHDLRNPLSAIGMCVTALEAASGDDSTERGRLLSTIRDSVHGAQLLIADLLDISSIEAGRLSFEARPTDSVMVVAKAAHLFERGARARRVRLDVAVPDDIPPVTADESRILQVFSNLLSNALKYTESGGRIALSATPVEMGVEFAVGDTGPGIPAEDLPQLFDRFWHSRRGQEGRGTGLGLAIAKGIVEAHGGRIWAETVLGSGTTFKFSLPRATSQVDRSSRVVVDVGSEDSARAPRSRAAQRRDDEERSTA